MNCYLAFHVYKCEQNSRSTVFTANICSVVDICSEAPMYVSLPTVYVSTTGSVHATSIAASRVEQALSEVASSLQSSAPKQGPLHPWMTLAQIWLHAGTNLTHSPICILLTQVNPTFNRYIVRLQV